MLGAAQNVAGAANFQVPHGDAEAAAEAGKFPDGLQPLLADLGKRLAPAEGEVGIGPAAAAPHPAPQLVQLRKPHPVGVLYDEGVAVGDIDPRLDDGGTDENIDLPLQQTLPDLRKLLLAHFAMGCNDARLRQLLPQVGGGQLYVIDAVVQVKYLPAPPQLLSYRLGDDMVVIFQHIGLHRVAVLRRLVDDRHIPDAAHCHVQRPGDGGGGKGQDIHAALQLFEFLLLLHAKALLLIDDAEAQIAETDILLHQAVGPHHHIDLAIRQPLQNFLLLLWRAEAGKQLHRNGVALQPPQEGLVVLPRQDGSGHQHSALLAIQHALKDRPQGDLRFAKAHIAAQQPVHGGGLLHIVLDLLDAAQLIVGLLVFKALLKLGLPVAVRAKGKALYSAALGIQLDELRRHILHRFFDPLPGAVPFVAAQPVQLNGLLILAAHIFGHQVQLGDGDIQHIGAGIADLDIILGDAADFLLYDPLKNADAVRHMDHGHAGSQIGQLPQHLALLAAGLAAAFSGGGAAALGCGNDSPAQLGVFKAGGKPARQHKYFTGCNIFRRFYKSRRKSPAGQILGQRQGAAFGTGQQPYGPVPLPVAFQVLTQGVQRPAPNRKRIGRNMVQPRQRQAGVAAGKAIQNDGGEDGQLLRQHPRLREQKSAARGQSSLLQQGGHILLLLPAGVVQALLQVHPFGKQQQPLPPVGEQIAARRAQQPGIAVGGRQGNAPLQQLHILP